MQLNELSYLQTIAQQHSISAAAAKLNLSQQRLSRIVQNIENELGLKIFTRSKKGVILTKDGVQFMKYLQNILTAYEDMQHIKQKQIQSKHLICGIDKHISQFLLKEILQVFASYPQFTFSFVQFDSAYEMIDALLAQKVQLAVNISAGSPAQDYFYAKYSPEFDIACYPLAKEKMYGIVHQNNPLSAQAAVTLSEVISFPMTFCAADSTYSNLLQNELAAPINIFLETDNLELQLECINRNLAVGLLDGFTLPYIQKRYPELCAVPLTGSYNIVLAFYFSDGPTPADTAPLKNALKNNILQLYAAK